ncbi:MAG TPA: hypothetical protein VD816_03245 [Ohtaekwangia sp.]|nr:hypothetical protein [Ohtaekwangia sp.]
MVKTAERILVNNEADRYKRISAAATIALNGTVVNVFPLFGPVREKAWADGWDPEMLFAPSDEPEERMIFRTKSAFSEEDYYTWIITQYRPAEGLIEYTVSTQNRIWFIRVQCDAAAAHTRAMISYTYTALNDLGEMLNRHALDKMFARNLKDWEEAINHYLVTGNKLIN